MLVELGGGLKGTVGGGCGEAEVYELAVRMLERSIPEKGAVINVDLTEDPQEGGGKVCGGRFDVLLHLLEPADLPVLQEALESVRRGERVSWVTGLGGVRPGFWKSGQVQRFFDPVLRIQPAEELTESLLEEAEQVSFLEPLGCSRTLVIVGAGHIARPLCAMASLADYRVVVLDDRAEYAREEFFSNASSVLCGEYHELLPGLAEQPLTSVVLVTRGHRHDQECLRLIVERPLEYLGMIGSKRRIEAVFQELAEEGVSAGALQRVCAPIGLDIGARTPAEIACCILAEMIFRRRRPGAAGRNAAPRERNLRSFDIQAGNSL